MKRARVLLAVALLLACGGLDIEELPTAITLNVNRTSAPVGQPFEFSFDATGRFIAGVILDFGDGALDSINGGSAQRLGQREIQHSYTAAGSYTVTATVVEAGSNETASDSETVQVTGG